MGNRRHIAIFTTASLPWMTGTAVNPLFRAAYLAKDGQRDVSLIIPWLSLDDQHLVYPNKIHFTSPAQQEDYVRNWLNERTSTAFKFNIQFYPGKFSKEKRSILPVGDLTEIVEDGIADIAVLEEPEHLTWYHHGRKWKTKFRKVIGIVHTNYLAYVKREKNGLMSAFLLKYVNSWVVDIYCHKVIRLSAATQELPRSVICNVHGVNPRFLEIGKRKQDGAHKGFTKGAYYIGKMVWGKGYTELLQLLEENQEELTGLKLEMYGTGEDSDEVKLAAQKLTLDVSVLPGRDHGDPIFHDYKVFINPSTTDVVCTTTAEALAMGKIVICAEHPSNEFFKQFPNCYTYNTSQQFVKLTLNALNSVPVPLTDQMRHELSWESATERFMRVSGLEEEGEIYEKPLLDSSASSWRFMYAKEEWRKNLEDVSASFHNTVSGIEAARCAFGAIPNSIQPDEKLCKELGMKVCKKEYN